VNAITLGGVWRNQAEQFVKRYIALTPLDRMATEEDFKGAAAYLASDLSAYVTGHNLIVDGGWTAW
jgi:NAD(P)-dependent dehydrogenase (short-subunit alcohol dehydrogenase family)